VTDLTIESYIDAQEGWRADALRRIDTLIRRAAPEATGLIKWAQPVYEQNGPLAFIKSNRAHLTFGFWRGTELNDPDGVLEGAGDRMKHVKIHGLDDIDEGRFSAWIREAVVLNEQRGNPIERPK
jgi:hypothetical protein